ncbi:WXG100 family type VII secretion target [Nocardia macrotermitis]|uniref:PPE family domain-containing protein n=1 Tax=Nocardia macrotermitis TaxID=2585198 RepID=A0A7K0D196_9NOCA|nr:hypothetical protein [Nocardia macrotermitis]MQY19493.1 hypothetical protein [Nocardia macrotermitis]
MVSYESAKIPGNGENADSYSHWDIYNKFNPLDTNKAHSALQDYDKLAQEWSAASAFFASRIQHSSSAAWQGKAADASRTAISNYTQRAEDLTDALKALSTQVTTAVDGVNNTKHGVAEPMQHVSRWNFWDGDFMWHHGSRSKQKIDQARDEAREAMKNNYVKNFVGADKSIPVIPKPNEISNPLYTYTPTSSTLYTPNSGTNPSDSGANHSGTSGNNGSQSDTSSSQSNSTSTAGYASSSMPTMSGYSSSTATTPSSFYSGTSPTSTTPSNYSGLGSGTGGDSALNGLGSSAGGGGLGKSVPGTGSNATAAAANAAKAAGNTAGNLAGMGGMGGAAGKSGSDDKEHSLPDWLRNMENTLDLLGPEIKTLPGGVIGGDREPPSDNRG